MRHFFNRLFSSNPSEVRGFLFLLLLIGVMSISVRLLDILTQPDYTEVSHDVQKLDSIASLLERDFQTQAGTPDVEIVDFPFDPNTVSIEELILLGLDSVIAQRVVNYRSKGGLFKIKSDFSKIYGLNDDLFKRLEPFITLPDRIVKNTRLPSVEVVAQNNKKLKPSTISLATTLPDFDLNQADTAVLQTISGIGSVLSKRIIKYRSILGGYIDYKQLYAVYNLDSIVISRLKERSYITEEYIPRQIQLNQASIEELSKHPFIEYQQARLMVAYRNQHGSYRAPTDLMEVYSIDSAFVKQIGPYLNFSE